MKNRLFVDIRGASVEEGVTIWEEYLKEARTHVNNLKERAIEIRYEDFLKEPGEILKELSDFCGLGASDSDISKVASHANKSRAYAYLNNPELSDYAEKIADRLKTYGY
jgi:hypothetical protein